MFWNFHELTLPNRPTHTYSLTHTHTQYTQLVLSCRSICRQGGRLVSTPHLHLPATAAQHFARSGSTPHLWHLTCARLALRFLLAIFILHSLLPIVWLVVFFVFFFVTNAKVLLCGAQLTASCLPHATNPVHFHMESSSNSTRRASLVTLQQTVSQKPIWCVLFCLRRNLCGFGGCGLTFLLFSLVGNFRPFYAQTHTHI